MRQSITLLVLSVAVFSSCTTAYKTGQTPDDVYYSPVRQQAAYVQAEQKEERPVQTSEESYEDRFLRMRIEDRYRWSALDDYYFNNAYAYNSYGNYYSLNSPWNSYWAWNCHYNPYYGGIPYYPGGVIMKTPRTSIRPSRALVFNPSSYNIGSTGATSAGSKGLNNSNYNRYNNRNQTSNSLGESIRKVFSNGNNSGSYNSGSNSSTPSRSYSPSSSNSSSSGGGGSRSSGGGGGVSRPSR
ncbi:MAG TPA: hypothetical protein VFD56_06525 [Chitinophagaceae bacterium]|nr:hypothetical protein [Chitinophagaceae bacterium]